ncbi:PHP domain-containing protein [Desulfurivibrio alkaliphilus]|uniref:PHP domain protein n=1 Tax=Desulfurivibrio alkaliphilus (strain DSM 19089 / UNIQEM U267 / AHT2) TaxID=589865 RepID=D6Z2J2_DESAT|nr:PHP domain-containing protein [Desulfurivibrio alkaliphilus]ADH85767.1 PHP domain protein [Desulfurivibrio alkaliphilus AHT 2]
MNWIDLHTHSTFSDGALTPSELVDLALQRGLQALALTDHDTVAGLPDFLAAATDKPIQLIGGIEISAWHKLGSLHILGYGLNHSDAALGRTLAELQQARHQRNLDILTRLNDLGIEIDYFDLQHQENGQVGRPHIARALVRKGVVNGFQEAFYRYLRRGSAAYVNSARIHALDAIRLISAAGGAPVLAHPAVNDAGLNHLPELLPELRRAGLAGLEIHYPAHNHKQHQQLLRLAAQHRLLVTGGTDFHEPMANGVPLGGNCRSGRTPYACYQELRDFLDLQEQNHTSLANPHPQNLSGEKA